MAYDHSLAAFSEGREPLLKVAQDTGRCRDSSDKERRCQMACCSGTCTWFSCYPSACGSDGCCCNSTNCSAGCSSYSTCGQGACCTCNNGNWGYAIANNTAAECYFVESCGTYLWFSSDCNAWNAAPRVDTNGTPSRMADLTKSLFAHFAPLTDGVVGLLMSTDATCIC
jgi:hypothetical protein